MLKSFAVVQGFLFLANFLRVQKIRTQFPLCRFLVRKKQISIIFFIKILLLFQLSIDKFGESIYNELVRLFLCAPMHRC